MKGFYSVLSLFPVTTVWGVVVTPHANTFSISFYPYWLTKHKGYITKGPQSVSCHSQRLHRHFSSFTAPRLLQSLHSVSVCLLCCYGCLAQAVNTFRLHRHVYLASQLSYKSPGGHACPPARPSARCHHGGSLETLWCERGANRAKSKSDTWRQSLVVAGGQFIWEQPAQSSLGGGGGRWMLGRALKLQPGVSRAWYKSNVRLWRTKQPDAKHSGQRSAEQSWGVGSFRIIV